MKNVLAQAACLFAGRTQTVRPCAPAARRGADRVQSPAMVYAAEADRQSAWPTHRIRCFLQMQDLTDPGAR